MKRVENDGNTENRQHRKIGVWSLLLTSRGEKQNGELLSLITYSMYTVLMNEISHKYNVG